MSFATAQRWREAKARYRRWRNQTAPTGTMRGVIGLGDGSGQTWASAGPPVDDSMWVRLYNSLGELTNPQEARNLSLHEFAEGDPVTVEWMSSRRAGGRLKIVYREQEVAVVPTSWTGLFTYTHEVVVDPPATRAGGYTASGTSSSTFPVSLGTVDTNVALGRNVAGRIKGRWVNWTRVRNAVQTGTPAFIIATLGHLGFSALAPVSDTASSSPGDTAAPIDADGVTTGIYQNHGNGSIVVTYETEIWEPEAHLTYESDADYVAAAEMGDLFYP